MYIIRTYIHTYIYIYIYIYIHIYIYTRVYMSIYACIHAYIRICIDYMYSHVLLSISCDMHVCKIHNYLLHTIVHAIHGQLATSADS